MADQEDKKPDLVVDEDWKEQVAAENEAIDAKSSNPEGDADTESSPPEIDPSQIPPASFPIMVSMFSTQAMTALGVLPNPMTGKLDKQLAIAKHYIDLLGVLDEKTKGNLDDKEQQMLESSLHELRMVYVQQSSQTT